MKKIKYISGLKSCRLGSVFELLTLLVSFWYFQQYDDLRESKIVYFQRKWNTESNIKGILSRQFSSSCFLVLNIYYDLAFEKTEIFSKWQKSQLHKKQMWLSSGLIFKVTIIRDKLWKTVRLDSFQMPENNNLFYSVSVLSTRLFVCICCFG